MTQDKSHMIWSQEPNVVYGDGAPIPRVTYRCRHSAFLGEGLLKTRHGCRLITDHTGPHSCICGRKFGREKVEV